MSKTLSSSLYDIPTMNASLSESAESLGKSLYNAPSTALNSLYNAPSTAMNSLSSSYSFTSILFYVVVVGLLIGLIVSIYNNGFERVYEKLHSWYVIIKDWIIIIYAFIMSTLDWINKVIKDTVKDDDDAVPKDKPASTSATSTITTAPNMSEPANEDNATFHKQVNSRNNGAGYCYIGKDKGNRTCAYVNETDKCMSGDVFPTRDICINPSLR
jgi:hypothetical protein